MIERKENKFVYDNQETYFSLKKGGAKLNQEKLTEGLLVAQEGLVLDKINIQALLKLLVEKKIISREEVEKKRQYIERQPFYRDSLDNIHQSQKENNDMQDFAQHMSQFLKQ